MTTVMIVDDEELVRFGLRTLLENEDGMEPAGEAADGLAAVTLAQQTTPDVILMDIRMPGIDGLAALRRITTNAALAHTKVIMLTTFEHDEYIFDALHHGASGFLLKDTSPTELLEAIRAVIDGGALMSPSVTRKVVREFVSRAPWLPKTHPELDSLTDRQRQILTLVAEGLNNGEIAARLAMRPATARTHVSRVMIKLGARSRAQLVVFAYQSGLAN